ncbi:hypothetical protein [Mucilaginibacter celer]|uniref:Uncharacterized protein n=1 Tax=Mucilaginibacter celer TaxID=2305508 RepID=A0A494VY71_9SPHI|nr:hypothetical protein [Mucilaginibacter celer]AYL98410.1 hypothetical protein HYN43_025365 [Mucilaginibacter celer]
MKKQLLWAALLMAAVFTSCSKNELKPEVTTTGKDKLKTNTTQPTYHYADLLLQPRQAGENFDTYKGVWSGAEVKMIGTPTWYQAGYPTLTNGIPGLNASYGVYSNGNMISSSVAAGQDFIILSIGTIALPDLQAFQKDVDSYMKARDNYEKLGGQTQVPLASDYIKDSYTSGMGGYITVTGKLIRVTTGSHWALASVDYPTPTATAPASPKFVGAVPDPNDNTIVYDVYGTNGNITITKIFKNGTEQGMAGGFSSGTYTFVGGNIYHVSVTVYRANGTSFTFNGNLDIS